MITKNGKLGLIAVSMMALQYFNPAFASSSTLYEVTNLGTLGEYDSRAYTINNSGQIAGRLTNLAADTSEAMYWDKHVGLKTMQSLGGKSRVLNINNMGQLVGVSNNHAAVWSSYVAVPQDLGTLGGPTSFAIENNDQGMVVGYADMPDYSGNTIYHAFVYKNGTMTDLGTLFNNNGVYWNGFSFAYGINNNGKVVGVASTPGWGYHAFVWDADNGMTDLGTHPDFPSYEGYATAINETGNLIAGVAIDADSNSYPLIWNNGATTPQLVAPHALFPNTEFDAVNNNKQVVGTIWDDDDNMHAMIYEESTGIVDLNDLISPASGWQLNSALGINDSGDITGWGTFQGARRAYLLTMTNHPTASLSVTISNIETGSGAVHSYSTSVGIPGDISCINGTCSAVYPYGSIVNLTATPGLNSAFEGWSGTCATNPCSVTMDADKSYTATFNSTPVSKNISTGKLYTSLGAALSSAQSGAEIRTLDTQLDGAVNLDKAINLRGGWYATYQSKSGLATTLNGNLTISNSDSTTEDLLVKGQLLIQGGSLQVSFVTVRS